jgi:glyoxylase-like metal-dependent hydrolase (beta-lactamase superfamily II)
MATGFGDRMTVTIDETWRPLTACGDVRVLKYSWGPANANALALRLSGEGWLVVSPPLAHGARVIEELAEDGGVSALLAPNAYHYLGNAPWRERLPSASSWAPRGAHERLAKKAPGSAFGSAEQLRDQLPENVRLVFPEGQKSPDLLLHFRSASGEVVWWLGDLFSNTTRADQIWPLRILAQLAGSGPGYRRNRRPELVYVRDRAAWLASVRRSMAAHPPTIVVPAHGDAVTRDTVERTAKVLDD